MDRSPLLTVLHVVFTAVIGIVVLANGLAPYFGLKWEYSMAMFSDLRTDVSNHLFMPLVPVFPQDDYYIVEELTTPGENPLASETMLRDLLGRIGHPAGKPETSRTPLPVHRDLVCFHLKRFHEAGVPAVIRLRHADNDSVLTIAADSAPEEWRNFGVWLAYPLVRHSYAEIHQTLAAHFDSQRAHSR